MDHAEGSYLEGDERLQAFPTAAKRRRSSYVGTYAQQQQDSDGYEEEEPANSEGREEAGEEFGTVEAVRKPAAKSKRGGFRKGSGRRRKPKAVEEEEMMAPEELDNQELIGELQKRVADHDFKKRGRPSRQHQQERDRIVDLKREAERRRMDVGHIKLPLPQSASNRRKAAAAEAAAASPQAPLQHPLSPPPRPKVTKKRAGAGRPMRTAQLNGLLGDGVGAGPSGEPSAPYPQPAGGGQGGMDDDYVEEEEEEYEPQQQLPRGQRQAVQQQPLSRQLVPQAPSPAAARRAAPGGNMFAAKKAIHNAEALLNGSGGMPKRRKRHASHEGGPRPPSVPRKAPREKEVVPPAYPPNAAQHRQQQPSPSPQPQPAPGVQQQQQQQRVSRRARDGYEAAAPGTAAAGTGAAEGGQGGRGGDHVRRAAAAAGAAITQQPASSAEAATAPRPAAAAAAAAGAAVGGALPPDVAQMVQIIADQHKTLQQNSQTFHMQQVATCAERLVDKAVSGLRLLADGQPCVTGENAAVVAQQLMDGVLNLLNCGRNELDEAALHTLGL